MAFIIGRFYGVIKPCEREISVESLRGLFRGNINVSCFYGSRKNNLRAGASELLKMPQKYVQIGGVAEGYLNQLGILTRDARAFQNIGATFDKGIKICFLRRFHFKADKCGYVVTQLCTINGHVVTFD